MSTMGLCLFNFIFYNNELMGSMTIFKDKTIILFQFLEPILHLSLHSNNLPQIIY